MITNQQLIRALYIAISRTYFAEIIKNTPGKGIVADAWEINIVGNNIIISNKEFGDIIKFLEEGTKPHIIEAKDGGFLKFKAEEKASAGNPIPNNIAFEKDGYVYTKKARHPGIAARKFIYKILSDKTIEKQFETEFELQLKKLI